MATAEPVSVYNGIRRLPRKNMLVYIYTKGLYLQNNTNFARRSAIFRVECTLSQDLSAKSSIPGPYCRSRCRLL